MKDLINTTMFGASIVAAVVAIMFALYAFLGFTSWLMSDPFEWVETWSERVEKDLTARCGIDKPN